MYFNSFFTSDLKMKPSSFAGDGVTQKTVATSKIKIGVRIHAFLMELELSCP